MIRKDLNSKTLQYELNYLLDSLDNRFPTEGSLYVQGYARAIKDISEIFGLTIK